jgi:hypothetical protein
LPQKAGRIDESERGLDRIELVAPDAPAKHLDASFVGIELKRCPLPRRRALSGCRGDRS